MERWKAQGVEPGGDRNGICIISFGKFVFT